MFAKVDIPRAVVLFAETLREIGVLMMVFVPLDGWLGAPTVPVGSIVAAFCLSAICAAGGILIEARR
ncbi:MAG: hypothetical protein A3G76_01305 [Acidobacteria bacterium RIFCSPLOWO2_12_FULL_65_11]|nr:MAG: hypothetical protein A3H95_12710 [Acidobacteria bacterium RIFCSPLOWO2_02_FULL_64_15]OFW33921.1 MAG: hypothetical protein A3G76_01305 [Acidobacteria bacterium RIFCSPLOWO2_12_FULL_65_11]